MKGGRHAGIGSYRRRRLLRDVSGAGAAVSLTALLPRSAGATPERMRKAIVDVVGERSINPGRVRLDIPAIAENGSSVKMMIEVDSPIDGATVESVYVFAEKNPLPDVGRFHFTPEAGRATVITRIRLADSQTITAIARFSDGSLWSASTETVVTLASCIG